MQLDPEEDPATAITGRLNEATIALRASREKVGDSKPQDLENVGKVILVNMANLKKPARLPRHS